MNQIVRGTWFATALFVTALVIPWRVRLGWGFALEFGILAVVVTPVIWWWLVAHVREPHPGRGAGAGALISLMVHAIVLGKMVY